MWWRLASVVIALAVFITVAVTGPVLAFCLGVDVNAGGIVFSVMGALVAATGALVVMSP